MASSEILLIALGSGFLALCGPKCDLLAIAGAVLLAGFLGRVQALIAASAFSLVVLGVIATGHRFPQEFTRNGQFAAAISAIWCCAIFALSSKSNRGSDRSSNNPFEIRLDELTNYVWSRHADGTVEYVSPDGREYLGIAPRTYKTSLTISTQKTWRLVKERWSGQSGRVNHNSSGQDILRQQASIIGSQLCFTYRRQQEQRRPQS